VGHEAPGAGWSKRPTGPCVGGLEWGPEHRTKKVALAI